ncbi:MAG TPA: uroporphyrinogen-III synthase, partial [Thermoanaerobaculia bacterium]|nr:uroporphyrinogen-III synthase [Thermoanaerobaculia bacterium]
AGARILFPSSSLARETLGDGLAALGAVLERVEAYRTLPARLDVGACYAQLDAGAVDAVTFTSPSAIDGLERAFGREELRALLDRVVVATLGPTTSAALAALGRAPDAEAAPSTLDALVAAVERALAHRSRSPRAASSVGATK